jgi:hypothetical protein
LSVVEFPAVQRSNLELVVCPSPHLRDGAHANNAWLLECPDPVSRICWTNIADVGNDGEGIEFKGRRRSSY